MTRANDRSSASEPNSGEKTESSRTLKGPGRKRGTATNFRFSNPFKNQRFVERKLAGCPLFRVLGLPPGTLPPPHNCLREAKIPETLQFSAKNCNRRLRTLKQNDLCVTPRFMPHHPESSFNVHSARKTTAAAGNGPLCRNQRKSGPVPAKQIRANRYLPALATLATIALLAKIKTASTTANWNSTVPTLKTFSGSNGLNQPAGSSRHDW